MRAAPTNTAPGSAGQNGAHTDGVKWSVMGEDLVVHADGPWTYSIATVYQPKYARLIAAAPQMLEALRGIRNKMLTEAEARDYDPPADVEIIAELDWAIAAATGEAV